MNGSYNFKDFLSPSNINKKPSYKNLMSSRNYDKQKIYLTIKKTQKKHNYYEKK